MRFHFTREPGATVIGTVERGCQEHLSFPLGPSERLELLGRTIKDTSICALGQTAPNPILTTMKYFRKEYEEHIREKRCHAGVCDTFIWLCAKVVVRCT